MGVLTLNPISIYNFGRGSWGASSGSLAPSTVNSANGVYARLSSNYGSGANGASLKFKVAAGQLPGGAKVEYMRPGFTIRTSSTASEAYFRSMIQNIRGGNGKGQNAVTWSGQLKLTTTFATVYGISEKTTKSNNIVYGDGSITQTDINNLVVEVFDIATTVVQIDRMWIEVSYDLKPTIDINAPGTIGETTSPIITFDYDDDKMPLDAVDVELYSGSTLIHSEDKLTLDSPSYGIPISLEDGTYTIKMRAYQQWNYAGDAPVSDWDQVDFTIQIGRPAVPEFVAIEEPSLARVRLVAKSNLNLLSNDAAEGMPAAWNDTFNCAIATGTTYESTAGDRSLLMKVTSGGVGYMKAYAVPLVPVTAGGFYAFGFDVRAYTGDTLSTVQAGIRWLNAAGAQISESYGASVLEVLSTWKPIVVNAQAPVGAVYAKCFISVNSSQTDGWHYIDALQLQAQAALAEPLPTWSRGGFATPESINLLSYGDSTLEGISHWTAVAAEAGSREAVISVVNVSSETGGGLGSSYQGDNMLKLQTEGILARRDIEPAFASGTAISVPKGDTLDGDFMLVFVQVQTNTTTVATPAGWTQLNLSTGTSQRIYCFYKFASGEATTLTFTASAAGKHAIALYSYTGIDTTTPIDNYSVTGAAATVGAGVAVTLNTVTVPHNGFVINALFGRRVASTVVTSFTSNLGGTNDILLSSINNTAAEVATGIFSRKYNTGSTTALSVSGRTITPAAALTDVMTWNIVLRPDRSTVRATLRDYEYYEYDTTQDYVIHAAVQGASNAIANAANRQVSVLLDVYDNDKNYINGYYVSQVNPTPGVWTKMSSTISLADNPLVKFATLRLEVDQMTDSEAYYFDALSLYQASTNLGYIEGYKEVDGPYLEVEYSEDNGITWKTADDVDGQWMVQKLTDFNDATIEFYDYEIGSGTERLYRMYNWKIEEGNILESEYSGVKDAEINLYRIWMHIVNNVEDTIYHFEYDGAGRDDTYDKQPTIQQFAGREYGQVYFGEASVRNINANVQLPTGESIDALRVLDSTKALVIFRDGRGRRVKGLLTVKISDERWGQTASLTVQVLGLQP